MVENFEEHKSMLSEFLYAQKKQHNVAQVLGTAPEKEITSLESYPRKRTDNTETEAKSRGSAITTLSAIRLRMQQLHSCRHWCCCICHKQTWIETPNILGKFIGSFQFRFAGIPALTTQCNEQGCRKRSRIRIQFNYLFPRWILSRVLNISLMYSNINGPEFLLRTPRVRDAKEAIFVYATQGDVEGIKGLLSTSQASASDVDQSYQSALFVSIIP